MNQTERDKRRVNRIADNWFGGAKWPEALEIECLIQVSKRGIRYREVVESGKVCKSCGYMKGTNAKACLPCREVLPHIKQYKSKDRPVSREIQQ